MHRRIVVEAKEELQGIAWTRLHTQRGRPHGGGGAVRKGAVHAKAEKRREGSEPSRVFLHAYAPLPLRARHAQKISRCVVNVRSG